MAWRLSSPRPMNTRRFADPSPSRKLLLQVTSERTTKSLDAEHPSQKSPCKIRRDGVVIEFPTHVDPWAVVARVEQEMGVVPKKQDRVFDKIMEQRNAAPQVSPESPVEARNEMRSPAVAAPKKIVRDTSRAVYRRMQQTGALGAQERQIMNLFMQSPDKMFTRNEVSRDTGIRINSCTARINKLITEPWDFLEEFGKRKCSVTGENCYQLRIKV
jgi:hypothetical protein